VGRLAAQVAECILVGISHAFDQVRIVFGDQLAHRGNERQAYNFDDARALGRDQAVRGERGFHRSGNGMLAVDDRAVAIEQDEFHDAGL
jgi:hypothetical protein